jgi:hypothetical protein
LLSHETIIFLTGARHHFFHFHSDFYIFLWCVVSIAVCYTLSAEEIRDEGMV